jgi:hypothetical protein
MERFISSAACIASELKRDVIDTTAFCIFAFAKNRWIEHGAHLVAKKSCRFKNVVIPKNQKTINFGNRPPF